MATITEKKEVIEMGPYDIVLWFHHRNGKLDSVHLEVEFISLSIIHNGKYTKNWESIQLLVKQEIIQEIKKSIDENGTSI